MARIVGDQQREETPLMFWRLKQVKAAVGMSRSWIYDAIRRHDFPAPIALGARAVGWDSRAIAGWQARQIEAAAKRAEAMR